MKKVNLCLFGKYSLLYLFGFLIVLNACRRINNCDKKEKFTLSRQDIAGTQMKLNGYYYSLETMPMFFYRNGVLHCGSVSNSGNNIIEIENQILTGEYYNKIKNRINEWSLFSINGTEVKYEYFLRKGELNCWYPVIATGEILNDSTLLFTSIVNSDGTEPKTIHNVWHFKAFSPKPDSTNSFLQ